MYVLDTPRQIIAVSTLCEGLGIRAAARVVGAHRDTIMRLGRNVGEGYARLHDEMFVNLTPRFIEMDEAWSFVFKKQARLQPGDHEDYGDQYSYIAMDADRKAIISYLVGKRTNVSTIGFALDLRSRTMGEPQLTSDGFGPYVKAVDLAFGSDADFAMLIKKYETDCSNEAKRRYGPSTVVDTDKIVVSGDPLPSRISTSYIERQNLTLRMLTKRFSRLSNGFSKLLRNHNAAMDLYVGYYNLCKPHETLKGKTPAMAVGVAKRPWTVEQFMGECLKRSDPDNPPDRNASRLYNRHVRGRSAKKGRNK